MKRPMVWCAAAFVCGIFIKLNFSFAAIIVLSCCFCFTAFCYRRSSFLILIPIMLSGFLPITAYNHSHLLPINDFADKPVSVSFYITDCLEGKTSANYLQYIVKTDHINNKEETLSGIIYTREAFEELDVIEGKAVFYPLLTDEADLFNYKTRLINQGHSFTAVLNSSEVIGKRKPDAVEKILLFRKSVIKRIESVADSKNFGFLSAILTGDKSNLTSFRNKTFQKTGISHLMAVSGFHVSMLLGFLLLILRAFRVKKSLHCVIGTAFLLFLLPFMGFSPSATRAVIMNALLLWSTRLWRDNDSLSALSFAAIVILVVRPYSLLDASFVLSFTATLGLILLSSPIQSLFMKYTGRQMGDLSTVLAVFIFLIPVNIYYFGSVSFSSVISNLIFIPLFPFIMLLLIVSLCLSGIFRFLPTVLNYAVDLFLDATEALSRMPISSYGIDVPDTGIYLLIITTLFISAFKNNLRWMFIFLALVIAVNTGINIHKSAFGTQLYFYHGGDLYAVIAKNPDSTIVAADCGEDMKEFDYVNFKTCLDKKGIKGIDIFLIINYNSSTEFLKTMAEKDFSPSFVSSYYKKYDDLTISFSKMRLAISTKDKLILNITQRRTKDEAHITGFLSNPYVYTPERQKFKNNYLEFLISGRGKVYQKGFSYEY